MISRPVSHSDATYLRAAGIALGILACVAAPTTAILAASSSAGLQAYIVVIGTLLALATVGLVVGLAREAIRGVRQMQVQLRVRRRRIEAGMNVLPDAMPA